MTIFKFNLYAEDMYLQAQEIEAETAQEAIEKAIEGYEDGQFLEQEERYDSPGDVNEVHIIDSETDEVLIEYVPPAKRVRNAGQALLDAAKPFTAMLQAHHEGKPDDLKVFAINDAVFTVGDLRRLVEAVKMAEGDDAAQ